MAAGAYERESTLRAQLRTSENVVEELRSEMETLLQRVRSAEAAQAVTTLGEPSAYEHERLSLVLRDKEAALAEERELVRALHAALHQAASDRDGARHPAARGVAAEAAAGAAAEAVLLEAMGRETARVKAAAADALRGRREDTVGAATLRRELALADADVCAARVDAGTLASSLAAARASLAAERSVRARVEGELEASRREVERLAARVAYGEEEGAAAAAKAREAEAERRHASAASLRERDEARAALEAANAEARGARRELEESARALHAARAEVGALEAARARQQRQTSAELAALHEEAAAAAAAGAADRAALLAQLTSAQEERRQQQQALDALKVRAHAATSLEEVSPRIAQLLFALERREEAESAHKFATATAADGTAGDAPTASAAPAAPAAPASSASPDAPAAPAAPAAAREASALSAQVHALREEVENLELELASRPSVRAVRELTAKISELEATLAHERRSQREPLWATVYVPKHTSPTRDAIRRDREIGRLGGIDVDSIAPAERHTLLVDVCRLLGVQSVHSVVDRLKRLCAVVSTTPALETFVRSTRAIVASGASAGVRPGAAPPKEGAPPSPRALLGTLKTWAQERTELAELRVLKEALAAQLGQLHAARAEARLAGAAADADDDGGGDGGGGGGDDDGAGVEGAGDDADGGVQWPGLADEPTAIARGSGGLLGPPATEAESTASSADAAAAATASAAAVVRGGGAGGRDLPPRVMARPPPAYAGAARGGGARGGGGGRARGGARRGRGGAAHAQIGAAEHALARTVAEAIGERYAEVVAAGGLSAGAVCAALREMVGAVDAEGSLRRVRQLVALEDDVQARTVEVALALGLKADATLPQCLARLHAIEAAKSEASELIDATSARELLRRVRAHDGPSALEALSAMETKAQEYRKAFGRFQQQMTDFATTSSSGARSTAVGSAAERVWRGEASARPAVAPPSGGVRGTRSPPTAGLSGSAPVVRTRPSTSSGTR